MASEQILTLTAGNFDDETRKAGSPLLVDFWAEWCGPCRMLAPVLDQLAKDYDGRVRVGKLNVDEHSSIATRYGVMSIPTLIVFKDGQEKARVVGARGKEAILREIEPHFAA